MACIHTLGLALKGLRLRMVTAFGEGCDVLGHSGLFSTLSRGFYVLGHFGPTYTNMVLTWFCREMLLVNMKIES